MKKYSRSILILILLFLVTSLYVGCSKKKENVIKIGAILPLTGNQSFFGISEKNGFDIAIENINRNSKYVYKVYYEDSKGNTKDAVSAAKKLLEINNVNYLFTSLSGVSYSVSAISQQSGILQFVLAMDDKLTSTNPYAFRTYPGITELSKQMIDQCLSLKPKTIAVLYIKFPGYETLFEQILIPTFINNNINIVLKEVFTFDDVVQKTRAFASKVKSIKPDMLIVGSYYNAMSEIFKIIYQNNIYDEAVIVTDYNILLADNMNIIDKELLNELYVVLPAYGLYLTNNEGENFKNQYREKYNNNPNYDAAFAYDALNVLSSAIDSVGINNYDIINYMTAMNEYRGASGLITIDSSRNWQTHWVKGKYVNGQFISK